MYRTLLLRFCVDAWNRSQEPTITIMINQLVICLGYIDRRIQKKNQETPSLTIIQLSEKKKHSQKI